MNRPKCEATGKIAYPTQQDAETAHQPSAEAWAYLCPAGCNQWHLTSARRHSYAPDRRRARQHTNRTRHRRT